MSTQPALLVPSGIFTPGSSTNVPGYALGPASYDPSTHIYNAGVDLIGTRAALAKAAVGEGQCHFCVIADSSSVGYNGAAFVAADAWPTQMGNQLATQYGITAKLGAIPAVGMNNLWTLTGNVAVGGLVPSLITFGNAAGTASVQFNGTDLYIQYGNNNSATLTYAVDGGASNNLVPSGAQSWAYAHLGGLANGAHTVVISGPGGAAGSYIGGVIGTSAAPGLYIHNLAIAGSTASVGNDQQNWSIHDFFYALSDTRHGLLAAAGITPNALVVLLGGNDLSQGSTVARVIAGYQDIISYYPNSELALADAWNIAALGTTAAQYESLISALCRQADTSGAQLWDWYGLVGGYASALALGLLGPDATHPTDANSAWFGRSVAAAAMSI